MLLRCSTWLRTRAAPWGSTSETTANTPSSSMMTCPSRWVLSDQIVHLGFNKSQHARVRRSSICRPSPTVRCPSCSVVPPVVRRTPETSSTCIPASWKELPRWTITLGAAPWQHFLLSRRKLATCQPTFPLMSSPSQMGRLASDVLSGFSPLQLTSNSVNVVLLFRSSWRPSFSTRAFVRPSTWVCLCPVSDRPPRPGPWNRLAVFCNRSFLSCVCKRWVLNG